MSENPLHKLEAYGQSVWLDFIQRDLLENGELAKWLKEYGLKGITSNPAIFEKAISTSNEYNDDIRDMVQQGHSVLEIYESLSQTDIRNAADLFRPVYQVSDGIDGYVSLEVNPHLANDTQGTIDEARRLWKSLDRPNVMIKVPATAEGLPAIEQLISEGINVNVTLLFGLSRYHEVAEAYIAGLGQRQQQGHPIDHVASVASFFISRIDTLVDVLLEKYIERGGNEGILASKLRGHVAISSARLAYQMFKEVFTSNRFITLTDEGAHFQRLLWASTSTKNPDYSDVLYIEDLIGPNTVNTVPVETIHAYHDHGTPLVRLESELDHARWVLEQLPTLGIDLDAIAQQLEDEGVAKFNQPFDKLMTALEKTATSFSPSGS